MVSNDNNGNNSNKGTTDNNNDNYNDNNNENDQPQRIPSPSSIFVGNIKNYFIFRNELINLISDLNFTSKSTANNFKIEN